VPLWDDLIKGTSEKTRSGGKHYKNKRIEKIREDLWWLWMEEFFGENERFCTITLI
jgi:hypothetical protein